MKHLVNYINEGIFGDNINSVIKLNGIEIDDTKWKLCEEYFKKRRKKYFENKSTVSLGDMSTVSLGDMYAEYNIVYNEDDCVVAAGTDPDDFDVYVLCPETIYMCHEAAELHGRAYAFPLTNIDEANDFDISFNWYQDSRRGWMWIGGSYSGRWVERMEEAGFESLVGYVPSTISKKAKDIIKKYTKK